MNHWITVLWLVKRDRPSVPYVVVIERLIWGLWPWVLSGLPDGNSWSFCIYRPKICRLDLLENSAASGWELGLPLVSPAMIMSLWEDLLQKFSIVFIVSASPRQDYWKSSVLNSPRNSCELSGSVDVKRLVRSLTVVISNIHLVSKVAPPGIPVSTGAWKGIRWGLVQTELSCREQGRS